MDNQSKTMKFTPHQVTDTGKVTKTNGKVFAVSFTPYGSDYPLSGSTFSDTIAAELEKNIDKLVTATVKIGSYNGSPSYSITEVNGVRNSGFKKGSGFAKDVVSIERQTAAKIATDLLGYKDITSIKNIGKDWEKLADVVYIWISKRPSEPDATGGKTEQAVGKAEISPEDREIFGF